jgi:acyl carrier protein
VKLIDSYKYFVNLIKPKQKKLDFLDVFNYVAKVARPAHTKEVIARAMEEKFVDIGLDSLDVLIMLMYFSELYGIAEAKSKEWTPESIQKLHALLMASKTKEPSSMKQVQAVCK